MKAYLYNLAEYARDNADGEYDYPATLAEVRKDVIEELTRYRFPFALVDDNLYLLQKPTFLPGSPLINAYSFNLMHYHTEHTEVDI